jgi:hypothetical protein
MVVSICGWPPQARVFWHADDFGRVLPYVRPIVAVAITAGLDEVRGSDPNQNRALQALDTTRVVPIVGLTVRHHTIAPLPSR